MSSWITSYQFSQNDKNKVGSRKAAKAQRKAYFLIKIRNNQHLETLVEICKNRMR